MIIPTEPATVVRHPLDAEDRRMAAPADKRLRDMQSVGVALGVGLILGGCYMAQRGHTGDAVAGVVGGGVMWVCVIVLGRAKARDERLATKDVITGVILRRRRFETRYNVVLHFDVGGVEVAVPAAVFDRFSEGQAVRVERLSGSGRFLFIEPVAPPTSAAHPVPGFEPRGAERGATADGGA